MKDVSVVMYYHWNFDFFQNRTSNPSRENSIIFVYMKSNIIYQYKYMLTIDTSPYNSIICNRRKPSKYQIDMVAI